jgi:Carboxypeptidase regulatory-like domain
MLRQSKSLRLRFVVSMCMVLAAGAVSMGTSCITAPKGKGSTGGATGGTINGSVDSLNDAAPIPGVTVTATDSATAATFAATTGSDGTFSITHVVAGHGTLTFSNLPVNCTPPQQTYAIQNGGTLTYNQAVNCQAP